MCFSHVQTRHFSYEMSIFEITTEPIKQSNMKGSHVDFKQYG